MVYSTVTGKILVGSHCCLAPSSPQGRKVKNKSTQRVTELRHPEIKIIPNWSQENTESFDFYSKVQIYKKKKKKKKKKTFCQRADHANLGSPCSKADHVTRSRISDYSFSS